MELTQNKEKNEAYKKRAAELVSRMTLDSADGLSCTGNSGASYQSIYVVE